MTRRGLLALAALTWVASPAVAAESPRLVIEPESFDFGEALPQKTLAKEFRLSNQGRADLVIEEVATDCGCTVAGEYEPVLPPGGVTRLRIELSTGDDRGSITRRVLVRSNDPGKQPREIRLTVRVVVPEAE